MRIKNALAVKSLTFKNVSSSGGGTSGDAGPIMPVPISRTFRRNKKKKMPPGHAPASGVASPVPGPRHFALLHFCNLLRTGKLPRFGQKG
jgi:hypothetical protein